MMRDEINDRLRAAVHHFKTGDGAPTVSGLGGDWATTDISVSYDDGYMVLHLKPLFPVTDLTADKPAGGAPLELEGLKFTADARGIKLQGPAHTRIPYGLTWKAAAKLSEWLQVEVDKHRAPVAPTVGQLIQQGYLKASDSPMWAGRCSQVDLSPEALTAAVWSGEGLPPLGCVCEVSWDSDKREYVECLILAHDGDRAVFRFITGARNGQYSANDIQPLGIDQDVSAFRPLRTVEQIAAEAREAALKQIVELIESADSKDKTIAEALYDAGLRFPDAGYRKEDA